MADNASQFTAQRPQVYYPQTIQYGGGNQQVGFLSAGGGAGGLLDLARTARDLISGTSADRFNDANANAQKQRDALLLMEKMEKAPKEVREQMLEAAIAVNPSLEGLRGKFDFAKDDLTLGDPAAQMQYQAMKGQAGMFTQSHREQYGMNPDGSPIAPQEPGKGAATGQQVAQENQATDPRAQGDGYDFGQYHQTLAPVEPTTIPIPAEEAQQEQEAQQPTGADTPKQGGGMIYAEEPPVPTTVDTSNPTPDDVNTAKVRAAMQQLNSNGYNLQEDDFWVSPLSGEVNLKPHLAVKYPEFPPAAFEDVLAETPEAAMVQKVVETNSPAMIDTTRRMAQLNAGVRLARSYTLNQQPDYKDALLAAGAQADVDLLLANLKVETGMGYDPEIVNFRFIQAAVSKGQWLLPVVDSEVRGSEQVTNDMIWLATLPEKYQVLADTLAQQYSKNAMDKAEFDATVAQNVAMQRLKAQENQIRYQGNYWEYLTDTEANRIDAIEADAATTNAQANMLEATTNASQALTPAQLEAKYNREQNKLNAETEWFRQRTAASKDEVKNRALANGTPEKVLEAGKAYLGDQGERDAALMDSAWKRVQSAERRIDQIDETIRRTSVGLPEALMLRAQQGMLNTDGMSEMEKRSFEEAMKNTSQSQAISTIQALELKKKKILEQDLPRYEEEYYAITQENLAKAKDPDRLLRAMMAADPAGTVKMMEGSILSQLPPNSNIKFRYLDGIASNPAEYADPQGNPIKTTTLELPAPHIAALLKAQGSNLSDAQLLEIANAWKEWYTRKTRASKPLPTPTSRSK